MKMFVSEKMQIGENTSEKKGPIKMRFSFLMEGCSLGKSALGLEIFESSLLALLH